MTHKTCVHVYVKPCYLQNEADHRQIPSFWEENPIYSSGRFTVEPLLSRPKEQQDSLYYNLCDFSLTSV